jgi:ribonuclease P protein component
VSDPSGSDLLRHSNFVKEVVGLTDVPSEDYDIVINLSPSVHPSDPIIRGKKCFGFWFDPRSSEFYEVLYGRRKTSMNQFQVYYRLAGMTWKGQGYGLNYYPKTKVKNNRVGVSISHSKLRHYVIDHLVPRMFRIVILPYRKNVLRRMDEINVCQQIVTDDNLTMHLSLYLRKKIHFLETIRQNTPYEFFGSGKAYQISDQLIK